jgi:chromosome segregation ATPase
MLDRSQIAELDVGVFMDDDGPMDTEIAQLNVRLTSLETEFAVQNEVAAVERASYANKEDIKRIEVLLANGATKQDMSRIEASLADAQGDIARIDMSLAAARSDIAHIDASLTETRSHVACIGESVAATQIDIARIDAVLDSIHKNHATKADVLQLDTRLAQVDTRLAQMDTRLAKMELRLMRWMLATLITGFGIASTVTFTIIKLTQ